MIKENPPESRNNGLDRNNNFNNLRRGNSLSNFQDGNNTNNIKSRIKRNKSQNNLNSIVKEKSYNPKNNIYINNEKNTQQLNYLYSSYQSNKNNNINYRIKNSSVPHNQTKIENDKINPMIKRKLGFTKTNKLLNSASNYNYFNSQTNINRIEKQTKKEKPIYNNIKSCIIDNFSDEDDLWCEICINKELAEERKKIKEIEKKKENNYNNNNYFEDKNRYYISNLLNDRINKREQRTNLAYEYLAKLNKIGNSKERLIKENENSQNSIGQYNNNDSYERFKTKYNQKQKFMQEHLNNYKIQPERKEINTYYSNYVYNPNCVPLKYGEYEPKKKEASKYLQFLDEQIKYKNSKKKKEKEINIRMENLLLKKEEKKYQEEENKKMLKEKKIKEDLLKANLELINAKKRKNYSIIKKNENGNNRERANKRINSENKNNEIKIINVSENNKKNQNLGENKENFKSCICGFVQQKEEMGRCKNCNRILPKKLLSPHIRFTKS